MDSHQFYAVEIQRHPGGAGFLGHLDSPTCTTIRTHNPVRLRGWIFGKILGIAKLILYISGEQFKEITVNTISPDVATKFSEFPGADRCRFNEIVSLDHLNRPFEISIQAVFVDGSSRPFGTLAFSPIEATERPIFIVGSPRSGTTILGFALQNAINPNSFNEGHVLPLLHQLRQMVGPYYENSGVDFNNKLVMLSHVPKELITQVIEQIFKDLYSRLHDGREWIDKTPGGPMLRSIPTIQAVWPHAKFVLAKRRGLENVVSRLIKFPQLGFESHCRQWVDALHLWSEQSRTLNPANYMMIDQYDIAKRPDQVASSLGFFLDLTQEQQETIVQTFRQQNPEQTGLTARAHERETLDIDELGWSAEEIKMFRSICGNMMHKYGYSETKSYYL